MKSIRFLLSENFQFLVVKFSVNLNRRVFVMKPERSHSNAENHSKNRKSQ